ncbi:hypothetical protein SK128_018042 [Halocaridina rubra]|uniref:Chitin-binding type-2 domain-containing protein n=1 Tax=Halocaridina rubra TaxID=373956 RepID=A0AAN9A6U2_HALRR
MIPKLLLQCSLLILVNGFLYVQDPHYLSFYQPYPLMYQQSPVSGMKQLTIRFEDQTLPCPFEGFFVHPDNCTRFYRCVDYAGTGYIFSRYLFECSKDNVFLTIAQSCVPGSCVGLPSQPHVITTKSPQPVSTTPLPIPGPEGEEPVTDLGSTQTRAPETTECPTEPISPDVPPIPVETTLETQPDTNECPEAYVQHADYCNIYHPCKDDSVRYLCPAGTAFDQPRQMCRITAQDDSLCTGKTVLQDPQILRSEDIGTHVRLPDSYILPPLREVNPQSQFWPTDAAYFATASPLQLFLWPTSRPTSPSTEDKNLRFRPLVIRPSSSFRDSSPVFTRDPAKPLEQVRRPVEHLHIPYYNPPEAHGVQVAK